MTRQRTCDGPTCEVTSSFEWANLQWIHVGANRGDVTYPDWELLFHSPECHAGWQAVQPTPKQVLVAHLEAHHHRVMTDRRPFRELSGAHVREHRTYGGHDHYHLGRTMSPLNQPVGWRTGGDVVVKHP